MKARIPSKRFGSDPRFNKFHPKSYTVGAPLPLVTLIARILGDAHEPLNFAEVVAKVRRARKKERSADILRTLEAMRADGYVRETTGPDGPMFATAAWP